MATITREKLATLKLTFECPSDWTEAQMESAAGKLDDMLATIFGAAQNLIAEKLPGVRVDSSW